MLEYGEPIQRQHFVGHRDIQFMHLGYCNHLPPRQLRIDLVDLDRAKERGSQPCPVCFPEGTVVPLEGYGQARARAVENARLFETAFPPVSDAELQGWVQDLGER